MKYLLFLFFSISALSASAQCDDFRYKTELFDSVSVSSDIVYGMNTNIYNEEEELKLDVYQPFSDTASQRALIIFAHGGSFVAGDKADPSMVVIGTDFAKMGYVTTSINYRLGITVNPLLQLPDSITAYAAIIRGVHDFRAAIRYFKQDAIDGNNQYNIDPNQIIIGGFSAGGFIVLHHAYLDEEEEWPVFDPPAIGIDGGLEGTSGNPGYDTDFICGLNLAGALGDTSWIQPGDEPMMSTHGTEDDVVPYGTDTLSFSLGPITLNIAVVNGSSTVHQRLDNAGVPNCFTSWEGQGHVPEASMGAYYDTTFVKARNFFSSIICGEEVNCEYGEIFVSVESYYSASSISVYPNPFREYVVIEGLDNSDVENIELFNLNGQRLYYWNGLSSNRLQLDNLESGLYILRVNLKNQASISVKLTK